MTRNTCSFYDSLRLVYELFTDYYECLRVLYDFIGVVLRILTSYYEHFTCYYEYIMYTLRMLTYCLQFGEIVEIFGITSICFSQSLWMSVVSCRMMIH